MARAAFTEADVRRAVRGAIIAGFNLGAVEVLRDGTIRLLPAGTDSAPNADEERNSCDGLFGCDT